MSEYLHRLKETQHNVVQISTRCLQMGMMLADALMFVDALMLC